MFLIKKKPTKTKKTVQHKNPCKQLQTFNSTFLEQFLLEAQRCVEGDCPLLAGLYIWRLGQPARYYIVSYNTSFTQSTQLFYCKFGDIRLATLYSDSTIYTLLDTQSFLAVRQRGLSICKFLLVSIRTNRCFQVASAQAVNLFVSCLTLVLIAMDRFLLTLCPIKW